MSALNAFATAGLSLGAGLLAFALTIWIERHAARLGLIQHPNHRSSHTVPTPRGGGLAIAVAIIGALIVLCLSGAVALVPVVIGVTIIAGLGFGDDLHDLPAALRFPIQAVVVVGLVIAVPNLPPIETINGVTLGGLLLVILVSIVGLWWLNLFNFIDGIDGIAGSQAVLILLGGIGIWWTQTSQAPHHSAFGLALISAAATFGFLMRNWPPARIFMGDAGSNALAIVIFSVALLTIGSGQLSYPTWLILPAVLVSDATVTLLRRTVRGERPWHAHRRHGYQQLSRLWDHRRVTLLYGAITLAWACPLSLLAQYNPAFSWAIAVLAYLPLVVFAFVAKAGSQAETGR